MKLQISPSDSLLLLPVLLAKLLLVCQQLVSEVLPSPVSVPRLALEWVRSSETE